MGKGPVPNEFAITGLGPVYITVSNLENMDYLLKEVFLCVKASKKTIIIFMKWEPW